MKPKSFTKWITNLDIPEPIKDIECVEIFHQQTKFYPSTNANADRRIATHLCDQRAILEASTNRKRFFAREAIELPKPNSINMPLGEAISARRSCRKFSGESIDLQGLSDLLATLRVTATAQSVAYPEIKITLRTYASGGGLYPVETYVAWKHPETAQIGIYHYSPHDHALTELKTDVPESVLQKALSDQGALSASAGCVVFFTGIIRRTLTKYGIPGYRFVLIEAGEMAQQLALASCASGRSSLLWGGSYDDHVNSILAVDGVNETLLLSMMIGTPEDV